MGSVKMYLTAAGDVVRLYNTERYLYHQKYKPAFYVKRKTVRDVAWSHDGKYFGIVADGTSTVEIAHLEENLKTFERLDVTEPTTVAFSKHENGCIGIGTKSGVVHTVNYMNKKVIRSIQSCNSKITAIDFNPTDSSVAAGTADGKVHLCGLKGGQVLRTYELKHPQVVSCVKFAKNNKGTMGAGCHHGRVTVWNINFGHLEAQFSEHRAPCTGVAFSPLNKSLMASVGFDYAVFIYDARAKKKMLKAEIPEAGTSVDIYKDGQTMATSTVEGTISIFDLRDVRAPVVQWSTRGPCVKIAYQPEPEVPTSSTASSRKVSQGRLVEKTESLKMAPQILNRVSMGSSMSDEEQNSFDDVFSPINKNNLDEAVPKTESSFMNGATISDTPALNGTEQVTPNTENLKRFNFSCADTDEFVTGFLKGMQKTKESELLAEPLRSISSIESGELAVHNSHTNEPKTSQADGYIGCESVVTPTANKTFDENFSQEEYDDMLNKYSISKGLRNELDLSVSQDSFKDCGSKEKETVKLPDKTPNSPVTDAMLSSPEKGTKEIVSDMKPSKEAACTSLKPDELLSSLKEYIDSKFLEKMDDIMKNMSTMHLFNIAAHSKQEIELSKILCLMQKEREDKCVGTH